MRKNNTGYGIRPYPVLFYSIISPYYRTDKVRLTDL